MKNEAYTLAEANHYFAVNYNNQIWEILGRPLLTDQDKQQAIHLAHASFIHWQANPKASEANLQRAYFMLALTYTYASIAAQAEQYARVCFQMATDIPDKLEDFDLAYAHLAMAGAFSIHGKNSADAVNFFHSAHSLGLVIRDADDKKIFLQDFQTIQAL